MATPLATGAVKSLFGLPVASRDGLERSLLRAAPAVVAAVIGAPVEAATEEAVDVGVPAVAARGGGSCLDLGEAVESTALRDLAVTTPFTVVAKSPESRLGALPMEGT